jgi:hypothetical protein
MQANATPMVADEAMPGTATAKHASIAGDERISSESRGQASPRIAASG